MPTSHRIDLRRRESEQPPLMWWVRAAKKLKPVAVGRQK